MATSIRGRENWLQNRQPRDSHSALPPMKMLAGASDAFIRGGRAAGATGPTPFFESRSIERLKAGRSAFTPEVDELVRQHRPYIVVRMTGIPMAAVVRRRKRLDCHRLAGIACPRSREFGKRIAADDKQAQHEGHKQVTNREEIRGGIAIRPEKRTWILIAGKVKVLDAHTLVYEDVSDVSLDGMMEAPELEQKGLMDGKFYPCGKDAADFLRKLIGDRNVTCIVHRDNVKGQKIRGASAFVGETGLNIEMVRNGCGGT